MSDAQRRKKAEDSRKGEERSRSTVREAEDWYEALSFEGLTRRANYRMIGYREDMLHILEKKESAALIYQILWRWLEYRRDGLLAEQEARRKQGEAQRSREEIEDRMWVYMSYNDFVREAGGGLGYNTVIRALDYLLQRRVIERRENRNPRFLEYEYRINKEVVRGLLQALPSVPWYVSKGAKGYPNGGGSPTQMGTGTPDPNGGGPGTQMGRDATQTGAASYPDGYGCYPNGGTTQLAAQEPSQEAPQALPQQQLQERNQPAAAALRVAGEELCEAEIALIVEYRKRKASESGLVTLEAAAQAQQLLGKKPGQSRAFGQRSAEASGPARLPVAAQTQQLEEKGAEWQPLPGEAAQGEKELSAEGLVQLFEQWRGQGYEPEERGRELASAAEVLALGLPVKLTEAWVEQVYRTYNDAKFRSWYGSMEVHHLPEREKSSGQVRLVRWIKRLLACEESSGPKRMEWQGEWVSEEEAHRRGYGGGFERFRKGSDPADDLDAAARRLAAEGKLAKGGYYDGGV